jgi:hypothetical protein
MNDQAEKPKRLSGNEGELFAKQHLVQLKIDSVNWKTLWQDPKTGDFWKEYSPWSEAHGGGPPEFERITEKEARAEFGSW